MENPYRSNDPALRGLSLWVTNDPKHNVAQHRVDITKDICDEVLRLCSRAGLVGRLSLKVIAVMNHITARPGLSIGSATPYGVEAIWNGGNRRHIKMLLTSAERLGAFGLHARLRETHAMKEEPVNTNTIPDTSAVLAKILDEGVPEPREATGDQTAEQSASVKLTHDPESTELFLMEMATHANERGEFSAKQGVEVLRSQFGFPQVEHKEDHGAWNQTYKALWRLSRLGKLEKLEFGYRIPRDTFKRLRAKPEAGTSTPVEAAPMPAEPRQTETREPIREGVLKAADLRTHIETLLGRSKAYREALERQEQVSVVLGELRAQIAQLQEREAELVGELEQLETATNDPFARETTEELDTIRKLLG